jgi:hypothetical protein
MTTKIIWWLCALLTMSVELEPDTNGTPVIERKNVPISQSAVERLIPLKAWRRAPITLKARLKHLIGIHTPIPTLRTVMRPDRTVESVRVVSECWVCDKEVP